MTNSNLRQICEICGTSTLIPFNISADPIKMDELESSKFQVTNKDYGKAIETCKCTTCGLIQPKYVIDYSTIIKLYSNVTDTEYLKSAQSRGESNFNQVLKIIQKYNPDAKTLLEIGAGSGTMLNLLGKHFDVEGIEPNTEFCEFARAEYGLKIYDVGFEEFKGKTYDVIVALDVIEHVVSPKEFVKKVQTLLNPNGILILGTPDFKSLSAKILRKKWYHIRPPHLFYFGKDNMRKLLEQNNLKINSINNFVWTLSAAYLFDSFQKLIFGKSFISFPIKQLKLKVNFFDSKVYVASNK